MDAPAQYPSALPEPQGPPVVPGAPDGDTDGNEQRPGKGRSSRHLHGHVPLSPGGTKLSSAVYLSDSHRAMLEALVVRMTEGGTWIAITGPAQIGKTVLVQAAVSLLPPDKLRIFQVRHSGPGPLSLKSVLGQILDTAEPDTVTSRDLDRANENLFLSSAQGGHAVLAIDDAQDLAADALRYLLALASHPEAAKLRLQVVLAGRPELWTTLQHQEFKPLRDKLSLRLTLDRLRPGEDQSYVERRLWVVGTSTRKAITQPALQEIVRFGAGVPGHIDQLLDRAAELRRQRGEGRITVRTARAAVAALTGAEPARSYQGLWMAGAGAFLAFACAVAFYVLLTPAFQNERPSSPLPPPSAPAAPPPTASQAAADSAPAAPVAATPTPVPAPPEGAAGPTKLADANLAAFDGNRPPPQPRGKSNSEADASQPEATTTSAAPLQPQPAAQPAAPPAPAPMVAEATEPSPAPTAPESPEAQQPSEPTAPASAPQEAGQASPDSPAPPTAQPQATEATNATSQPAEPAPAGQTAAAAAAQEPAPAAPVEARNQPEPAQQQDAVPAPPSTEGGEQADQKPVELAAARPMPAPPEPRSQPTPAPRSEAADAPSAAPKLSADLVAALVRRGGAMLARGDISAARLLYQPAAEAGSGPAAAALGRTFDPAFLASTGAIGIQPDASAAAKWYRKAASLGEPGMEDAIKRLEVVPAAANANSGGR